MEKVFWKGMKIFTDFKRKKSAGKRKSWKRDSEIQKESKEKMDIL